MQGQDPQDEPGSGKKTLAQALIITLSRPYVIAYLGIGLFLSIASLVAQLYGVLLPPLMYPVGRFNRSQ